MFKRIFIIAAVSVMAAGFAIAGPSTPPKHQPEWTNGNDSDPGVTRAKTATLSIAAPTEPVESVVPELAKIVVLCAQEEKKEFEREWGKYVKHHDLKGRDLQKAIKDVSDRAATHRDKEWGESTASMNKMAASKHEAKEAKWKAERQKIMNEVARQIFEPSAR